jgi:hypothetical protein
MPRRGVGIAPVPPTMKVDFSEATKAVQMMLNGFIERVPYIIAGDHRLLHFLLCC